MALVTSNTETYDVTETIKLPAGYSQTNAVKSLEDPGFLIEAFYWHKSTEGHDFWNDQFLALALTDEGRAKLLRYIEEYKRLQGWVNP